MSPQNFAALIAAAGLCTAATGYAQPQSPLDADHVTGTDHGASSDSISLRGWMSDPYSAD